MTTSPRQQGIFGRLLGKFGLERKDGSLANPDPWLLELFDGATPSIAGDYHYAADCHELRARAVRGASHRGNGRPASRRRL